MSITRPGPFLSKWAENGQRFDVPDNGADIANGKADIQTGFPEITMKSVINGGVPPWGQDHNGILYQITQAIQWTQAGGVPSFNQALVEKNGGYSKGQVLQGDDSSKPWVLWISVQDGNTNNPNENKINLASVQNGWRRYPVIEEKDGATLYYNDNGELAIFTAQNTNYKYVSWSTGSDIIGDGSLQKPFKTIDKAITVSPSVGNIIIYLADQDDHYWIGYGDVDKMIDKETKQWNIDTLPGKIYTEEDKQTTNPDSINFGYLSMGTRNITFAPYQLGKRPDEDLWNIYQNKLQEVLVDGAMFYSADKATLDAIGLRRPNIILCWKYGHAKPKDYWTTTYIRWCGLNGIANAYTVLFNAIEFKIAHSALLDFSPFGNNIGWAESGYNFMFNGCIIGEQCHSGKSFMFGAGETNSSSLVFRRPNYFADPILNKDNNNLYSKYEEQYKKDYKVNYEDILKKQYEDILNKQLVTISAKGTVGITADQDGSSWIVDLSGEKYTINGIIKPFINVLIMAANVQKFLGNSLIYNHGTLDKVKIQSTNSEKYKSINPNFDIT
ncbi:unnamed protein product [Commensalibacter communis]|uniref:Tail protein n=1 Tax=Commensalibacter communis TaxID=2972786 RepID=A0A9W4TT42_9PROT|nr:hypothetical protein [Commensalibacter communis]CAI3956823.1 unnamed protein product [Commensalibacter communis]CAI3957955.1 unnamed protein product [Commensalibacter communis]CAI3959561.1 unnamed protein product [Commensalibacter communis]CAI3959843.1 unnamed protein product [Commensalibacter communis]